MIVAQSALVIGCVLSALIAIMALSFTNRTNDALLQAGDDIAAVDALRLRLTGLAEAGERVLLADDGLVGFRELEGAVDRARQQLRARDQGAYFAAEADALDRNIDDFKIAVDLAASAPTRDPRTAFVAYRHAIKPVHDAFEASATRFVHKLVVHRDESSERTTKVATRARWALVFAAALAIVMNLAFAAGVMRALARQGQRAKSAAEHATRMAASRNELLAASKDLRRPIDLILCASGELKSAPNARLADEIHAAAERLREVVDELLDVSGIEAGTVDLRCERCDATALIEVAVESVQVLAVARAVHVLVVAPIPILVYVDRPRMVQVIATLIGMVIRGARPGGEVTVTVRSSQLGARFAISNAGAPMPREQLMTEESTMGLYVSKRLVEAHGGRVGVEENTLWLSLPTEPRLLRDPSSGGTFHAGVAS